MCWFFHKWRRWEVIQVMLVYLHDENRREIKADRQQRVCGVCGKIDRREL